MSNYPAPLSRLEIHLDQVRWNYLSLQKILAKGADCAAVVKADAYGLGAAEIAPELYKANCRHFYVGHAEEGMAVREALNNIASFPRRRESTDSTVPMDSRLRGNDGVGDAHIYILHGPYGMMPEEFSSNGLTPVLNTDGDIEYWSGFAKKTNKKQPAVIQIDTGMNRLGLAASEVDWLKKNSAILKALDIRYVMSHLACGDVSDHPQNRLQLEKFKKLTAELGLPCRLSLANSAGVLLGAEYHFDQARPGCALYGINPQTALPNPMQGVVTLQARILQTRSVDRGETVGYAASYKLPVPAKLATISAGYADGILRSFAGGGQVYIGGQKCPVVGRVSMDTIIVDASQAEATAGGWAEIIGPHQGVDDVAREAKTIGYEILTGLGRRYERIYSGAGQE